jgi:hypothetical protein
MVYSNPYPIVYYLDWNHQDRDNYPTSDPDISYIYVSKQEAQDEADRRNRAAGYRVERYGEYWDVNETELR